MDSYKKNESIRVLIIEDSRTYALILKKALIRGGFEPECTVVSTVKDILYQLKYNPPDIILCDYTLPDMNGLDAFEAVKATGADIPFVIVSGTITEKTAVEMMESGVKDYLMKENISRFVPLVKRELKAAKERKIKAITEENLRNLTENLERTVRERTSLLEEINVKLVKEISERNKTVNLLKETQKFLDTILENMPVTVYAQDPFTQELKFINRTGELLTGLKKEELIGRKVPDLFSKHFNDIFTCPDDMLISGEIEMDIREMAVQIEPDANKEILSKKILIKDEKNNPSYIIGIIEDHTIQKKTEKELVRTEALFTKLFKQSPVAICVTNDKTSKIMDINDSFLECFEYKRYEIIDKPLIELKIWSSTLTRDTLIEQIKTNGSINGKELLLKTKNGMKKNVLLSGEYLDFEDEIWLIFFFLDISEQKEAKDEIQNVLKAELELSDLKSRLISMISHEFRTPLTSIMLAADMLKRYGDTLDADSKDKHFNKIQDTVLGMTKMVENVLTIGRFETGKFKFNPERLDIGAYTKSLAESVQFHAKAGNIINYRYLGGCNDVFLDENLLGMILSQLLSNAIKFNKNGKSIDFNVFCHKNEAFFEIIDKGVGIPEAELKSVFVTFYRGSNVSTIPGYGLGLTIVRKAVDSHQGSIFIDRIENEGTKVSVVLPNNLYFNQ